jgi:hypothetical protein
VTTVDHQGRHVWARTPAGVRCAYMMCSARPDAEDTALMDAAIWVGVMYLVFLLVYRVRKAVRLGPR